MIRTQHLFGLDFAAEATIDDLCAELLDGDTTRGGWRVVVTPNVDHVVRYQRHAAERAVATGAALVLPDGMPIVWASRLLRRPLARRLAGSDLFVATWSRVRDERRPVVVLAASEEVASGLLGEHPTADVVVAPRFDVADPDGFERVADDLTARLAATGAEALYLCVGGAATHALVAALVRRAAPDRGCVVLMMGASPEFHLGLKRRAPQWMRRAGVEWLHRLVSEPRRLAHRYLVEDVAFVPIVWREWRTLRRGATR